MLNPWGAAVLGVAHDVAWPDQALAYIGPGAGLGGLAIALALLLGALFLLVGLVWYPLKRTLNGRRDGTSAGGRTDEVE